MMKRFFTVLLGSLAAIWISISLLFVLGLVFIVVMIGTVFKDTAPAKVTEKSVLYIDLGTTFAEENPTASLQNILYGDIEDVTLLQPALKAIESAADDHRIKGIFIKADAVSGGVATLASLNEALKNFREKSDKWVIAYGDQFTQGSYFLSSTGSEVIINPQGMIDIHGLTSQIMFYKGLLDKLGVEVQVLKVGTFKSAVEPYILTEISEANRLQIMAYLGVLWDNLAESMAQNRNITVQRVNELADSMLLTASAQDLLDSKLVDEIMYRHEVDEMIKSRLDLGKDDKIPFISLTDYYSNISDKFEIRSKNKIAVLYAVGEISESGSDGITSDRMVPQILKLAEDDEVKGLVLRVNSPGGSAFASEQIWEALEQFKKAGKPFYVSMGDLAASGGYYISCGADRIFASPVTLTGSIGIFGLIPNIQGLLTDHLGITVGTVSTNANGDFPTLYAPMTPFQQASMQRMIERGYETFVGRCAEGRGVSVDSIKAIAEGRVWAGATALNIGLVDELGSLDDAVKALAEKLELSSYRVENYPHYEPSLWDLFGSVGANVQAVVMRHVMGEQAYEIYRKARRVQGMDMVQCRMEDAVVNL